MTTTFDERLPNTRPLFIPFIMAGDPHPDVTIELALKLQEAGAHVIELGVPYSDPLADGPVIQKSAMRALQTGMSLKKAMALVPKMREKGLRIPVLMFTYYNPVLQLGENNFFTLLHENGIDGMLIPDLPFEESEPLRERSEAEGLVCISLVAPTSKLRIETIAKNAKSGFLYCVSSLGVTGERKDFHESIFTFLEDVKRYSQIPVAVGFGISSYDQIEQLQDYCDGFIIGSAIVRIIEELTPDLLPQERREQALETFRERVIKITTQS